MRVGKRVGKLIIVDRPGRFPVDVKGLPLASPVSEESGPLNAGGRRRSAPGRRVLPYSRAVRRPAARSAMIGAAAGAGAPGAGHGTPPLRPRVVPPEPGVS